MQFHLWGYKNDDGDNYSNIRLAIHETATVSMLKCQSYLKKLYKSILNSYKTQRQYFDNQTRFVKKSKWFTKHLFCVIKLR